MIPRPANPPTYAESIIQDDRILAPGVGWVDAKRIVLVWPERPWLHNADRTLHFRDRTKNIQAWRDSFIEMVRGCPRLAWARLDVIHETATARSCDVGACAPAVKAACDGAVDGRVKREVERGRWVDVEHVGILPDDSPAYIVSVTYAAPFKTGRDALTLIFTGPPEVPAPGDSPR